MFVSRLLSSKKKSFHNQNTDFDSSVGLRCGRSDLVTSDLSVAITTCFMDFLTSFQLVCNDLDYVLLVSPIFTFLKASDLTHQLQ
jgi:hypothetical protein